MVFSRPTLCVLALGIGISSVGSLRAQAVESVTSRAAKSGKLRMALIPVDRSRESAFTTGLMQAAFEDAMLKAGRFITLSRAELGAVQAEQRLAASGAVDPASAVQLGKALSANYVVIVRQLSFDGKVVEADQRLGPLRVGNPKYKTVYDITLQAQAIDVETSEIVQSKSFSRTLEGVATETRLTRPGPKEGFIDGYRAALNEFAAAFATELAAAIPLQAVVVLVRDANNIAINAGTDAGVRAGARFELIEEGEPIKDPSGAILGYDRRTVGAAEVVRVEQKLAWLRLTQTMSSSGSPDLVPDIRKIKQYLVARLAGAGK